MSLWIAITTIILLITSELVGPHSDYFGDSLIEKTWLGITALLLGAAFLVNIDIVDSNADLNH